MEAVRLSRADPSGHLGEAFRPRLSVRRHRFADRERCARIAAVVRDAFRHADPFPALPAPDGATESADSIGDFLARGGEIWTVEQDGQPVAVIRVRIEPDGGWSLSRTGVASRRRGAGLLATLLEAVEHSATAESVPRIELDAVIERCVPPYYRKLGYRIGEHHLATDDKLLTEVRMTRNPAAPRRPEPVDALGSTTVVGTICWLLHGQAMTAVGRLGDLELAPVLRHARQQLSQAAPGVGPLRLAGLDGWHGAAADFFDVFRSLPAGRNCSTSSVRQFEGGRFAVVAHQIPRRHHRSLWAVQRFAPGCEPLLDPLLESSKP